MQTSLSSMDCTMSKNETLTMMLSCSGSACARAAPGSRGMQVESKKNMSLAASCSSSSISPRSSSSFWSKQPLTGHCDGWSSASSNSQTCSMDRMFVDLSATTPPLAEAQEFEFEDGYDYGFVAREAGHGAHDGWLSGCGQAVSDIPMEYRCLSSAPNVPSLHYTNSRSPPSTSPSSSSSSRGDTHNHFWQSQQHEREQGWSPRRSWNGTGNGNGKKSLPSEERQLVLNDDMFGAMGDLADILSEYGHAQRTDAGMGVEEKAATGIYLNENTNVVFRSPRHIADVQATPFQWWYDEEESVIDEDTVDDECTCPAGGWSSCKIAHTGMSGKNLSEEVYEHVTHFSHGRRPRCPDGKSCASFIRLDKNESYRLDDRCHMSTHWHPPRDSRKQLSSPSGSKIFRQQDRSMMSGCKRKLRNLMGVHAPVFSLHKSDLVPFLLIELIENGFGFDLVLDKPTTTKAKANLSRKLERECEWMKNLLRSKGDDLERYLAEDFVESDLNTSMFTIFDIVFEKMRHPRFLKMNRSLKISEILSLILYSGCGCNYDMCREQRELPDNEWANTSKWAVFESCLFHGIDTLHRYDFGYSYDVPVYSGLAEVIVPQDSIRKGGYQKFSSFVSTSRSLSVAKFFRGNEGGIVFRISPTMQRNLSCCDLSWISKFPDEEEVLVSCGEYNRDKWFPSAVFDKTESDGHMVQYFSIDSCSSW